MEQLRFNEQVNIARIHPRVSLDISLRVFPDSKPPTLGRAQDISCGGISFYAPVDLAKGEIIQLSFQLPNSRAQFGVSAIVKNKDGFRYGAEFAALSPEETSEMERVIRILSLFHS